MGDENLKIIFDVLRDEVLELDIRNCDAKTTEVRMSMLAERIADALPNDDKQTPQKPVLSTDMSQSMRYTSCYRCPRCCGSFSGTGIAKYCYHCGQALDWGDVK